MLIYFWISSQHSFVHSPPPPTQKFRFKSSVRNRSSAETEVPYRDLKGSICFRHAVQRDQCFRSRYGTSFVESTAFDFGGGGSHCVMILSLVSGHALKKLLKLKVFVPSYLRFHRLITQLYKPIVNIMDDVMIFC